MTFNLERFKHLLLRWIVSCHIAFYQIENDFFRAILFYLSAGAAKQLPKASRTIRAWLMEAYSREKAELKRKLIEDTLSSIHISFDLWTSPNYLTIMSVHAYWIDLQGKRCCRLLALRRLKGEHSGENQAALLLAILKEYGIADKVGYFMLDNASVNDKAVDILLSKLKPEWTEEQRRSRRLRCLAHIINLCAQSMLVGGDAYKACQDLEVFSLEGDQKSVAEFWRKRGSLGRLHNIVKYIRMTPQRREEFASICRGDERVDIDDLQVCCRRCFDRSPFRFHDIES